VARSIYIASPNAGTGKSTVALGLVSCLTKVVAKVGVFRPFVESREGDAFLSLLLNRAGSTTPPEQCVGATWDEFHADPEEALARIVDAYRAMAREHDVVIIAGGRVRAAGTLEEVAAGYANLEEAFFSLTVPTWGEVGSGGGGGAGQAGRTGRADREGRAEREDGVRS